MDFKNYIVPKPWGYEYLIFENEIVAVWWLHLNKDARTSLHCHPDKKTGLVLLDGVATVSFLSNDIPLTAFSKIMIREGVFHSTHALSERGVNVLEVESPKNKENLVRLEDAYGRKGTHYESIQDCLQRPPQSLWVEDEIGTKVEFYGYEFGVESLSLDALSALQDEDVVILLSEAGIVSSDGFVISKGGDTIKVNVVKRLMKDFVFSPDAYALTIRRSRASTSL